MLKKLLIALLCLSLILEAYITFLCFFMPEKAVASMNETFTPKEAFPLFLIGWFLLLVTVLIGWLIYAVAKDKPGYHALIYILGLWWVAIGIAIFIKNGTSLNLISDSLKGLRTLGNVANLSSSDL